MVVLQFGFAPDDEDPRAHAAQPRRAPVVYTGTHDNDTVRGWYDSLEPAVRAEVDAAIDAAGVREREPHWSLIRLAFSSPAARRDGAGAGRARPRLGGAHEHARARSAGAWKWRLDRLPTAAHGAPPASGDRGGRAAAVLDSGGPMAAPAAPDQILDVNRRYHDVAAGDYDAKWGISFGEIGRRQVLGKVTKLLGARPGPFARSLEIGAGTGYFSLNLMQDGVIGAATCTDISPGMLETLEGNAQALGLDVETAACDAAELPFDDESFDLVLGHAVLHHLPDLDRAFDEFHRVLAPGGTLFFAGEPSRHGDRIAAVPKRAALRLAPAWRRAMRLRPAPAADGAGGPRARGDGRRPRVRAGRPVLARRRGGLRGVRVQGEELLANWFGWFNRTLEATADPADIPWGWIQYAYRGYLMLQAVDRRALEPRLPPRLFYNLMLAAAEVTRGREPPSPLDALRDAARSSTPGSARWRSSPSTRSPT